MKRKKKKKPLAASVQLEDLWAIWAKGCATGFSHPSEDKRHYEMHNDLADVLGDDLYLSLFSDGRFSSPKIILRKNLELRKSKKSSEN